MRYKRMAVTLLAIFILISVAYLNIGSCNKQTTCHFLFGSSSEQECSDDADVRSCNEFEFNPEEGICELFGCNRCKDDVDDPGLGDVDDPGLEIGGAGCTELRVGRGSLCECTAQLLNDVDIEYCLGPPASVTNACDITVAQGYLECITTGISDCLQPLYKTPGEQPDCGAPGVLSANGNTFDTKSICPCAPPSPLPLPADCVVPDCGF